MIEHLSTIPIPDLSVIPISLVCYLDPLWNQRSVFQTKVMQQNMKNEFFRIIFSKYQPFFLNECFSLSIEYYYSVKEWLSYEMANAILGLLYNFTL